MKNTLCFVGNTGWFSLVALQTLLAQQVPVQQIILAGYPPATHSNNTLPVAPPPAKTDTPTIQLLAAQQRIPIHYVGDDINHFATWKNFPHTAPTDFLFCACFPFRLPRDILQWPTTMAINLHPSLLPTYRGPAPLFWQLKNDETKTGFSLHVLTETLDTGPILLQKPVSLPTGASPNELDTLLAQQGTEALCHLLSTQFVSGTKQASHAATYQPMPKLEDYVLDTRWSARHAYNFINGTHTPTNGYPIFLDGEWHRLHSALEFDSNQSLDKAFIQRDTERLIQFSPGVLRAKPV